jgi:Hypervirulence associated proteins TUDOR domain
MSAAQSSRYTKKISTTKGHAHHASEDDPQYEIKSAKTDHIAAHKGHALKKASA